MNDIKFQMLCGEFLIDPLIALENENICKALDELQTNLEEQDKIIREILENEF